MKLIHPLFLRQSTHNLPPSSNSSHLNNMNNFSLSWLTHSSKQIFSSNFRSFWIFDTGATNHMAHSWLSIHISPNAIRLPTEAITPISNVGGVHLTLNISLSEVVFVPASLTTSKLTTSFDYNMILSSTHSVFQDHHTRITIGRGKAYVGCTFWSK